MPYNIEIAAIKSFSPSTSGSPYVSNWSFNPAYPLELPYILGEADLPVLNIESVIKNYTLLHGAGNVIIRAFISVHPALSGKVVLGGPIKNATPAAPIALTDKTGYVITSSNLQVTNTLTFTALNQLVAGTYNIDITFHAYRASASDLQPIHLETNVYNIKLIATAVAQIKASPNILMFSHLKNYTLPATQNITIQHEGSWSIKLSKNFTATAVDTIDNSTVLETILTGVGNKVIAIGITADFFNAIPAYFFESQALITSSNGSKAYVDLLVTVFEDANFKVSPTALEFKAVRGFTEADSQSVSISGFGAFTLEAPSWLQLSAYSGYNSGTFVVDPINSNNLSSGEYTGFIIIKNNVAEFQLPVTYIVEGTINTLLLPDKFNFTKDLNYININNLNLDTQNIIKILLTVRVYSYKLNKETVYIYNYTEAFYNYTASFHPGEIIERLMAKVASISDFNLDNLAPSTNYNAVYKPVSADVNIQIVNRITAAVVVEENLTNLLFVAGKTPPSFINNGGILSNNHQIKRVTKTSKELLSFVIPTGVYEIKFQKNKEDIVSLTSRNTGIQNIFQYLFDFANYEAGDVITIFIETSGTVYKKTYQLIPEGDHSFHVAFINQYKVLELLELTGGCTLSSDIKKIIHRYYKNLVERIETLDASKDMTLLINTGPIFKTDHFIIDEICRSKLAWLIFNDKPAIELAVKDKKLLNYDTDQELYDYELEFDINRAYDVENYSF